LVPNRVDCAAFAVCAIEHVEREILVAAYHLTVGSGIVGALLRMGKLESVFIRVVT
jgi:hypothetical protein